MELREWLPLAITGFVGLAGIVATLWVNLANLAAQKRRDTDAAAEREANAKREAEVVRRAHLLDERRAAYVELVTAALPWVNKIHRRMSPYRPSGDDGGPVGRADPAWEATERAVAMVQLVARPDVGIAAQGLYTWLAFAENDSAGIATAEATRDHAAPAVRDMDKAWSNLLTVMNADLVPSSETP